MAIPTQFSDIMKKHPGLIKPKVEQPQEEQEQKPVAQEEKPVNAVKTFNPFSKMRQQKASTPAQPVQQKTEGFPFKGKIKQVLVMDEDNNDDDPALIAVADKPYKEEEKPADETKEDMPEGNVSVKEAAAKAKTVKTEEPVKQEEIAAAAESSVEKNEKQEEKLVEEDKEEKKEEPPVKEPVKEKTVEKKTSTKQQKAPKQEKETKDLIDFCNEEDKDPDYFKTNVELLRQRYAYKDFEDYKAKIIQRMSDIRVTPDLNTGTIKIRIADIITLRQEIFAKRIDIKAMAACPLDKEYGDIYSAAKIQATGANEAERKANVCKYLKNFPVKEGTVDITFLTTVLKMYDVFFDGVIKELDMMHSALITFSTNLRSEAIVS